MKQSTYRNFQCWTFLFLLGGCGSAQNLQTEQGADETRADDLEIGPSASLEIPSIGTGWSSPGEKYMGRCVVANLKHLPAGDAASTLKISSMLDSEKAQQQLGFGLGAKAHFGIASASLQAQAASAMTQDAFSSVWVFAANYISEADELDVDGDVALSTVGKAAQRADAWQQECGDEFVYQQLKGAQLFLVYRLDFNSEGTKEAIDIKVGGSKSVVDVNGGIKDEASSLAQHAKLTIEVYQFGGDPTRITGIVTGPGANSQKTESAAKAVIKCDVDNLGACEEFLTNALTYATSLSAPDAFPQQIQAHANPVAYVTQPWSRLGHKVARAPMSEDVQEARLSLAMAFDKTLAAKKRVDLLLNSEWIDNAQRDELAPWSTRLNHAFSRIVSNVSACYDDLEITQLQGIPSYSTASENRCTNMVQRLTDSLAYPPPCLLRGSAERAIFAKWQKELQSEGQDPLTQTQRVDDVTCGFTGDKAICGYMSARGASAFVIDASIFDAWAKLSPEVRRAHAQAPTGDMRNDGPVRYAPFAPHGAFFAAADQSGEATFIADNVLDCWQNGGGMKTFGWPTRNQVEFGDNLGAYATFSTGDALFAEGPHQCVAMPQAVMHRWTQEGGMQSCLGAPTSRHDSDGVTRYTCFEGGFIMSDVRGRSEPVARCPWFTNIHCK